LLLPSLVIQDTPLTGNEARSSQRDIAQIAATNCGFAGARSGSSPSHGALSPPELDPQGGSAPSGARDSSRPVSERTKPGRRSFPPGPGRLGVGLTCGCEISLKATSGSHNRELRQNGIRCQVDVYAKGITGPAELHTALVRSRHFFALLHVDDTRTRGCPRMTYVLRAIIASR